MIDKGLTRKVSVTLPGDLIEQVRMHVGPGKFSAFCSTALRNHLAQYRQREGLSRSFGSWKDGDHPDLASSADTSRYIRKLRQSDAARTARAMDK